MSTDVVQGFCGKIRCCPRMKFTEHGFHSGFKVLHQSGILKASTRDRINVGCSICLMVLMVWDTGSVCAGSYKVWRRGASLWKESILAEYIVSRCTDSLDQKYEYFLSVDLKLCRLTIISFKCWRSVDEEPLSGCVDSVISCGDNVHGYFVYVPILRCRSYQNYSPQTTARCIAVLLTWQLRSGI
jgi:hypothetical protein